MSEHCWQIQTPASGLSDQHGKYANNFIFSQHLFLDIVWIKRIWRYRKVYRQLYYDDTVTLWHYDQMTSWHCETMTQWHCDTMTPWHCDTMTRWPLTLTWFLRVSETELWWEGESPRDQELEEAQRGEEDHGEGGERGQHCSVITNV